MRLNIGSVNTNDGKDEEVKFFTGLSSLGKISYFKLGEGGYELSTLITDTIDVGDGGKSYSGTVTTLPIAINNLTVTDGSQVLTDNGLGVLSGDGSGTVNYKTGAISVVFNSDVSIGTDIEAQYKARGAVSGFKTETIGTSLGTKVTYYGCVLAIPVVPSTVTVAGGSQSVTDDGSGGLTGDGVGSIDYASGEVQVYFDDAVDYGVPVTITYKYNFAPKAPNPALSDLESASTSGLYTFQRSFLDGEIVFQGETEGKIICSIHLDEYEGIDDGTGNTPVFFEGGIFSESDVMLFYFTFNALWNDGSTKINIHVTAVI